MRKIKDKQQDYRLKPNHINNYIRYKYSKHPYKKAEIVKLCKNLRLNYITACKKQTWNIKTQIGWK